MVMLAMAVTIPQASAQSVEKLSGTWFENGGKFGLVSQAGDFHPTFIFGECDLSKRQAVVQIEVDPKLFADVLGTDEYIFLRVSNGQFRQTLDVSKIVRTESAKYGWLLQADVDAQKLGIWSEGSQLTFSVDVGNYSQSVTRKEYLLPNENQQWAITSFIQNCFRNQPTRTP